jgi:hypothetical protein
MLNVSQIEGETFGKWKADGILGLAPGPLNRNQPDVLVNRLFKEGMIKKPMFSLFLSRDNDN